MFAVGDGGNARTMQTTLAILTDLVPLVVFAVFVVAAAADPLASLRHRLEQPRPQRQPRRAHGSHA
jgi:HAMP domain-containing protein